MPTIGSTAGRDVHDRQVVVEDADHVGGVLQHQPQPALAAPLDHDLADVETLERQVHRRGQRLQGGDRARRRGVLDGDDGGLPRRAAGGQGDEHERVGARHAERRVQQRRAGQQRRCPRPGPGTGASSAASRKVATSSSSEAWATVPPGSPSMRQARPARLPGWSTQLQRRPRARRRGRRPGWRRPPGRRWPSRSTCSRRSVRRSWVSRLTMRSSASVKRRTDAAQDHGGLGDAAARSAWVSTSTGETRQARASSTTKRQTRGEPGRPVRGGSWLGHGGVPDGEQQQGEAGQPADARASSR